MKINELTRRDFLKSAGATVAAAATGIKNSQAIAQTNDPVMRLIIDAQDRMSKSLSVLIINDFGGIQYSRDLGPTVANISTKLFEILYEAIPQICNGKKCTNTESALKKADEAGKQMAIEVIKSLYQGELFGRPSWDHRQVNRHAITVAKAYVSAFLRILQINLT